MVNNIHISSITQEQAAYEQAPALVFFLCQECQASLGKLGLPEPVLQGVAALLQQKEEPFKIGTVSSCRLFSGGRLQQLLVVGCGRGSECKPPAFRQGGGEAARALRAAKCSKALLLAPILLNPKRAHYVEAVAEGLYLGAYNFNLYKGQVEEAPSCQLELVNSCEGAETALQRAEFKAQAVSLVRDLVNQPGNKLGPEDLASVCRQVAKDLGLGCEVLEPKALEALGCGALLAVGQGSDQGPRLITLRYQGAGEAPYTAFVGKGITFDSGGLSLKPSANMGEMKDDMAGAAAVLGAIKAVAELKLPINLLAILACAENMPGGGAQRPGDIVTAASGQTIEVISTDAEGRLALADAVWYAARQGACRIVDIATLTGAVITALGRETGAIIASDDGLAYRIKEVGRRAGELWWQLPTPPDCQEAIKGEVADLVNSASKAGGGCITGGLFIGSFVPATLPWAHLDIGGTASCEKAAGFKSKGGSGFGTLTLIALAESLAAAEAKA